MFSSADTELRDSSELELCPSAAASVGFLLVSPVLLEEDANERGLLSLAWPQEPSLEEGDRVCSCLKSFWISASERLVTGTFSLLL